MTRFLKGVEAVGIPRVPSNLLYVRTTAHDAKTFLTHNILTRQKNYQTCQMRYSTVKPAGMRTSFALLPARPLQTRPYEEGGFPL